MRIAPILAGIAMISLATPALAQDTFYIVKEKDGKTCTIVKEKPTTETMILVDEYGEVYATEVEAEDAVKKTKICTETDEE